MKVGIEKDPINWEAYVPISLPLPKFEKMEVDEEIDERRKKKKGRNEKGAIRNSLLQSIIAN